MLNINRLRVLHEVAARSSLAGAAERNGHTPSAVSQQIAALESEVGVQLVERHTRGVYLTEAGRVLARYGETILADVHAAELALAALGSGKSGSLRLASFTTAIAFFVPKAIHRLVAKYPHV